MKLKTVLLVLSCFLILMAAVSVYALGPAPGVVTDVRFTVHNFSNNIDENLGTTPGGQKNFAAKAGGGANQVCVFCHTPHNSSPAVPLWNKVYDPSLAGSFKLYTSSATLSPTAKGAKITADSVSLICLSCHDGRTAINVLHNSSYRDATVPVTNDAIIAFDFSDTGFSLGQAYVNGGANSSNLGAIRRGPNGTIIDTNDAKYGFNLTDDHPIGFSYVSALGDKPGTLNPANTLAGKGIRLFKDRIECSSCHNPHVYYGSGLNGGLRVDYNADFGWPVNAAQRERTPFLSTSNVGSALCLGCHIK